MAIIGAAGTIIAARDGKDTPASSRAEPAGRILAPSSGDHVSRSFAVEGSLSAIPEDRHIWVVVQVGNLLFPKEPEIPSQDQRWAQQVVEAGVRADEGFTLALLMTGSEGQRAIEDWLDRGKRGEGFGGLESIPDSVKLDVVRDLAVS